jgi:hypothetical protein
MDRMNRAIRFRERPRPLRRAHHAGAYWLMGVMVCLAVLTIATAL